MCNMPPPPSTRLFYLSVRFANHPINSSLVSPLPHITSFLVFFPPLIEYACALLTPTSTNSPVITPLLIIPYDSSSLIFLFLSLSLPSALPRLHHVAFFASQPARTTKKH